MKPIADSDAGSDGGQLGDYETAGMAVSAVVEGPEQSKHVGYVLLHVG
jgi:hypothetical protein